VSAPVDRGNQLERLAALAASTWNPVVLDAQAARGTTVTVSVFRPGGSEVEHVSAWPRARSGVERVLLALVAALEVALPMRPTHVLLLADDVQVSRLLAGTNKPKATQAAWDALQRTIGRAAALGIRVYRRAGPGDPDGYVEVGGAPAK
jgi:hypothetical protein